MKKNRFYIIYSVFLFLSFSILSYIVSFLFIELTPFKELKNMYDDDMIYIYNYSHYNIKIDDSNDTKLYLFDFVEYDGNYYLKITMNKNAAAYGIAYDDSDTLFVNKINLELEEGVLYSNNHELQCDKYLDYQNFYINNSVFNVDIKIDYIIVDDTLTINDSSLAIINKNSVDKFYLSTINSRYQNNYIFDGAGFKNLIDSKYQFKISIILIFSCLSLLGVVFGISNIFNNYVQNIKKEFLIKNVYYKLKRQLINEYTNKNFLISLPPIILGVLIGFLLSSNFSITQILFTLFIYLIVYFFILRINLSIKLKKINLMKDMRNI